MLRNKEGISYYSSPNMEGISGIIHAFLGRTGGVSAGHLSSLNLGRREEDSFENIRENKRRVAGAFGIGADRIFTLSQVHSDRVFVLDREEISPEDAKEREADAIITDIEGVAVGVLTADCVPVLLFDQRRRVMAAIHAGWKGTAMRVSKKTVRTMSERFGCEPRDMVAAVGPSIGPCCYEVDDSVVDVVGSNEGVAARCGERWRMNLPKANYLQLKEGGVMDIGVSGICTSCRNDIFFSHRKEKGKTGRQLSFISTLNREAGHKDT